MIRMTTSRLVYRSRPIPFPFFFPFFLGVRFKYVMSNESDIFYVIIGVIIIISSIIIIIICIDPGVTWSMEERQPTWAG